MDFIERVFGVAPDGGSGALEFLYLLVLAFAVIAVWAWRARQRSIPRL
jgi:hypothetical protein